MTVERLSILKKFLEDDPSDPFNHYTVALEYVSMCRYPEAIAEFEEIFRLDANYVPAYHQLGLLFATLNRKEDALRIFEKGIGVAALVGDTHAQSEMQDAIDELG